jgi:hypothetical protein
MTWHLSLPREPVRVVPRCPRCELPTLPQLTACRFCGAMLYVECGTVDAATVPADTVSDAPGGGD